MKSIIKFLFLLTILITPCCKEDECPACFTPPRMFILDMVDTETGENLFANGTLKADEIKIINVLNDKPVDFTFIDENGVNYIQIHSIGWETEVVNCHISVSSTDICNLYVDAKRESDNCCSYTVYNETSIENAEFEQDDETGSYKIFI